MGWLRSVFQTSEPKQVGFLLEVEHREPKHEPTVDEIKAVVTALGTSGSTFASLTNPEGGYLQVAGRRPWCVIERRVFNPTEHSRAFQDTPNPKYNDGAKLRTGAGDITLKHDEWFLLKDAAEIFEAFRTGAQLPAQVKWRSMNEMFDL
jgi:hypothetical protein